jgi:DNA replication protein DnaC
MEISGTPVNKGFTIAISGKGGVGKTGLSTLLIRGLSKKGYVLSIDAVGDCLKRDTYCLLMPLLTLTFPMP